MSDILSLGESWCRLHVQSKDPRAMEQHGPNMKVSIAAITADGTQMDPHEDGAIIDTGAESCCVSPTMFKKLSGGVELTRNIAHVFGESANEKTIRATVSWMPGVEFTRDFSLLEHLEPYGVLIGRDVLKDCHFYLDQGAGQFWLYAPDAEAEVRDAENLSSLGERK
jgi:hypothetical protein